MGSRGGPNSRTPGAAPCHLQELPASPGLPLGSGCAHGQAPSDKNSMWLLVRSSQSPGECLGGRSGAFCTHRGSRGPGTRGTLPPTQTPKHLPLASIPDLSKAPCKVLCFFTGKSNFNQQRLLQSPCLQRALAQAESAALSAGPPAASVEDQPRGPTRAALSVLPCSFMLPRLFLCFWICLMHFCTSHKTRRRCRLLLQI